MIISNNNTRASVARALFFGMVLFTVSLIMSFSNNTSSQDEFIYEYGKASYYAHPFIGRKTASGEIFTEYLYTCAHKTLPFGTKLKITNLANNEAIIVRVNDRGPFVKTRVVDLSLKGAKELGLMQSGVANVSVEIVNNKFSSVGNVKDMEKIYVDNMFAYVERLDASKMDAIFEYLQNTQQMEEVSIPVKTYQKTGTKTTNTELTMEN